MLEVLGYGLGGMSLVAILAVGAAWWFRRAARTAKSEAKAAREFSLKQAEVLGGQVETAVAGQRLAESNQSEERQARIADGERFASGIVIAKTEADNCRATLVRLVAANKENPDVIAWARADATRRLSGGSGPHAAIVEPSPDRVPGGGPVPAPPGPGRSGGAK